MENQTNSEIVKTILETKNAMEKSSGFASTSMHRAQEANPVNKIPVLRLYQVIQEVQDTKGDARKYAAAKLVKSLNVKSAQKKCGQCGSKVEEGTKFCENCGAQLADY
jgi:hypothetical protein